MTIIPHAEVLELDRAVVRHMVLDAIAAGYSLTVDNGEDRPIRKSTNAEAVLAEMFATDEETLIINNAEGKGVGSAFLIYGEQGWDVICDHSNNEVTKAWLANVDKRTSAIADSPENWRTIIA